MLTLLTLFRKRVHPVRIPARSHRYRPADGEGSVRDRCKDVAWETYPE